MRVRRGLSYWSALGWGWKPRASRKIFIMRSVSLTVKAKLTESMLLAGVAGGESGWISFYVEAVGVAEHDGFAVVQAHGFAAGGYDGRCGFLDAG